MKNSFTDKSDDKNSTENQNSDSVDDRNPLHLSEYQNKGKSLFGQHFNIYYYFLH